MSDPITVLLVDDHELVRRGVRAFLETRPDITVVAEAGSGEEAVRLAAEHAPDVALMDLIMPGMDGVEATRLLTARSPRTSVVMLTSYHDDEHVFPARREHGTHCTRNAGSVSPYSWGGSPKVAGVGSNNRRRSSRGPWCQCSLEWSSSFFRFPRK